MSARDRRARERRREVDEIDLDKAIDLTRERAREAELLWRESCPAAASVPAVLGVTSGIRGPRRRADLDLVECCPTKNYDERDAYAWQRLYHSQLLELDDETAERRLDDEDRAVRDRLVRGRCHIDVPNVDDYGRELPDLTPARPTKAVDQEIAARALKAAIGDQPGRGRTSRVRRDEIRAGLNRRNRGLRDLRAALEDR